LCSAGDIQKQVRTHIGPLTVANKYSEYNLSLHLRYFLLCRFRELVHEVMTGIRPGGSARDDIHEQTVAYAAAAILHIEVDHFKCSLRNGALSARVSSLKPTLRLILTLLDSQWSRRPFLDLAYISGG
jgi:hypothetical protein